MNYRWANAAGTAILRVEDGAIIPLAPGNRDYDAINAEEIQPFDMPIDEARRQAISRLNQFAGLSRLKYITDAPGQSLTYDRKLREAAQAINDPAPTAQTYPVLAASIGSEVPSTGNLKADFDAVATIVMARESTWAAVAGQIEVIRLMSLYQIRDATTYAQCAGIVADAEIALKSL